MPVCVLPIDKPDPLIEWMQELLLDIALENDVQWVEWRHEGDKHTLMVDGKAYRTFSENEIPVSCDKGGDKDEVHSNFA